MLVEESEVLERKAGKQLYAYQKEGLERIFHRINNNPVNYRLLYQLPTGGGKTVIFSEIARQFIKNTGKKVLILTHRVELSRQTSNVLSDFGITNKTINSSVKELNDQENYNCFTAMVETLNNRLSEEQIELKNIGLVIIDEAHYNSFKKLFKYFENCFILGVTATPLSSNLKRPMKDDYDELIVGDNIAQLIEQGFLSSAQTYSYNVSLAGLKVGINGDYTVKSSEELYAQSTMLDKLLFAYRERALGKKTLIFNNGIQTSKMVFATFEEAGYDIRHLDNTNTKKERDEIISWFKHTPNAILTSVGILTTGFDEPTVDVVVLNRATKSITLYFQMIGRGSRILPNKKEFSIIDLGNNLARFGLWTAPVDWQKIFTAPLLYLDSLKSDDEIEQHFVYEMPTELRKKFSKTKDISFDVKKEYKLAMDAKLKSKLVLEKSIEQHANMVAENSEDVFDARILAEELEEDIEYRIRLFSHCICKHTKNYVKWLQDDYKINLRIKISEKF